MTLPDLKIPADTVKEGEEEGDAHGEHEQGFVEILKLVFGTCIVTVLVTVAFAGMANRWCVLDLPPPALFLILLACIILLAYVEALHYACKSLHCMTIIDMGLSCYLFQTLLIH